MKKFSVKCTQCPRLSAFLRDVRRENPSYHGLPVEPFGDPNPRLLIVGLAPGMHGANRTGRPFTGDYAGVLLYQTLFDFGFSTKPESMSRDDGLELIGCRITNAVKCLPPENKPVGSEINTCNPFLAQELAQLPRDAVVLALGNIAHHAVLQASALKKSAYSFGHHRVHQLPSGLTLVDSYHCSRYNTQTKRLTETMFREVFATLRELVAKDEAALV